MPPNPPPPTHTHVNCSQNDDVMKRHGLDMKEMTVLQRISDMFEVIDFLPQGKLLVALSGITFVSVSYRVIVAFSAVTLFTVFLLLKDGRFV